MNNPRHKMLSSAWLGAILGGFTYLGLNVLIEIAFPDHWAGSPTRLLGMSYVGWSRLLWIPDGLLLIGLIGLYRHLSKALGRLGKAGFWLAMIGSGLHILGNIIEFWVFGLFLVPLLGKFVTGSTGSNFGYAISGYGGLLYLAGLLIFGLANLKADLPARWRVLPFALGLIYASIIIFFLADLVELLPLHAVLFGANWILVGYLLKGDARREPRPFEIGYHPD